MRPRVTTEPPRRTSFFLLFFSFLELSLCLEKLEAVIVVVVMVMLLVLLTVIVVVVVGAGG